MNSEVLKKYKEAGKIWKKAEKLGRKLVKPGTKVLDITEKIEALIREEGGEMAFPLNIGIDDVAAHFTPDSDCKIEIKEDSLITLDIGVHVDGYIADAAFTLSMSESEEHMNLIEAAEKSLENAIEVVKPGVNVEKIGEAVEETMEEYNVKPISNLTGHNVDQYSLHSGLTIPNVKKKGGTIKAGTAIAIEPFSTNGAGQVHDAQEIHIYEFLKKKNIRMQESRKILQMAERDFNKLPFAKRWLEKNVSSLKLKMALKELLDAEALYQYPVLKEKEKGLVAQAEHTMIVQEDGALLTTA
ncbi:MAG: type II methionyl aminopeptidase [Candidatus Undinarchaeales archaeon]